MKFLDKLKNARNDKELTQSQLSEKLQALGRKVSAQQISSWERGDYFPSHRNLSAICEIFSLDLDYFIEKEGLEEIHPVAHSESDLPDEFSLVEKRKGAISAGPGLRPDNDVDFRLAFRNDWLEQFGGAQQLFVVRVEGDSMEPTLQESDTVLINKNANAIGAGGGIFAINWHNMVLVKRLQMNPQTDEIIIKSDNQKYDSMVVKPHEIQIEGKVIWYGRELR
ncbi:MAG: LexA family transcriptional regulator [Nitrospina sp.]|jgi:phage repressor protein C with HTH and peptisase S24 domain|nr:LexA family transcriptional regulator [Nitrospina sp.]